MAFVCCLVAGNCCLFTLLLLVVIPGKDVKLCAGAGSCFSSRHASRQRRITLPTIKTHTCALLSLRLRLQKESSFAGDVHRRQTLHSQTAGRCSALCDLRQCLVLQAAGALAGQASPVVSLQTDSNRRAACCAGAYAMGWRAAGARALPPGPRGVCYDPGGAFLVFTLSASRVSRLLPPPIINSKLSPSMLQRTCTLQLLSPLASKCSARPW